MRILVTGATGHLGHRVLEQLRAASHDVVGLSRNPPSGPGWLRGDLSSGEGIAGAATGMEAVVHAATAPFKPWRTKATDVAGTHRLLDAAAAAGVGHFIYVSIAGIDQVSLAYYRHKLAAEKLVESARVPWSILRATQFYTLMETYLRGFSIVPGILPIPYEWQFQPVDPAEVALRLVELVMSPPAGRVSDFGGPQQRTFRSLAQSWLGVRRSTRRLMNLRLPGLFSRQVAEGRLLALNHVDGRITWEQYLDRSQSGSDSSS